MQNNTWLRRLSVCSNTSLRMVTSPTPMSPEMQPLSIQTIPWRFLEQETTSTSPTSDDNHLLLNFNTQDSDIDTIGCLSDIYIIILLSYEIVSHLVQYDKIMFLNVSIQSAPLMLMPSGLFGPDPVSASSLASPWNDRNHSGLCASPWSLASVPMQICPISRRRPPVLRASEWHQILRHGEASWV